MGVILIRDRFDVGLLGEAIRAGVREVVAATDPAGLLAACARSLEVSRQMGPVKDVVTAGRGRPSSTRASSPCSPRGRLLQDHFGNQPGRRARRRRLPAGWA